MGRARTATTVGIGGALLLAGAPAAAGTATNVTRNLVYTNLAQAVEAGRDGERIELVGSFTGHVTSFADVTVVGVSSANLDGDFLVTAGSAPTLENFTIENGGGSAIVAHGPLTLRDMGLRGNGTDGGGLFYDGGSLTVERVSFTYTTATGSGGGIYLTSAVPYGVNATLVDVTFDHTDSVQEGGAIYGWNAVLDCTRCAVTGVDDTPVWLDGDGALTLIDSSFTDTSGLTAGAIRAAGDTLVDLKRSTFCGVSGGSVVAASAGGTVRNSVFSGDGVVAALDLLTGDFIVENNDFLGAPWGVSVGGVGAFVATVDLTSNLFVGQGADVMDIWGLGVAGPVDYNRFDATPLTPIGVGNLLGDAPELRAYADDGDCTGDDLVPQPWSPLIDAGDIVGLDPDGTRVDIGAYGGAGADPAVHADDDGDGFSYVRDCDDTDAASAGPVTLFPDNDGDGYGDDAAAATRCPDPAWTDRPGDCDDGDAAVHALATFARDADGDGYGDPFDTELTCHPSPGFVVDATDCDDGDPTLHALEVAWLDRDGDGHGDPATPGNVCGSAPDYVTVADDCDDQRSDVYPGAMEVCDGVDSNCALGVTDEPTTTFFIDADGDGYGDPSRPAQACAPGSGLVDDATDCDDTKFTVRPGATETCDGLDQDCNGLVDDVAEVSTWHPDVDADGHGDPATGIDAACPPDDTWVDTGDDCDDRASDVHPGAPEMCNDRDDDCDAAIDDGLDCDAPATTGGDPTSPGGDGDDTADAEGPEGGCGCASTPTLGHGLAAGLLLAVALRRRVTPRGCRAPRSARTGGA